MTLVSGSVDGDMLLWHVTKHGHTLLDQLSQRDKRLHTSTINHICSFLSCDGRSSALVCSVAADSQCALWQVSQASRSKAASQALVLQQKVTLPCMQMSVELSFVPGHPDWCAHFTLLDSSVNIRHSNNSALGHSLCECGVASAVELLSSVTLYGMLRKRAGCYCS